MDVERYSESWSRAIVRLLDIQCRTIHPDSPGNHWRPASPVFYCIVNGSGSVQCAGTEHRFADSYIVHAAADEEIVWTITSPVQLYSVTYAAADGLLQLDEQARKASFAVNYGFKPVASAPLLAAICELHNRWHHPDPTIRLQAMGYFYQWLSEIIAQWRQDVQGGGDGRIERVVRYMEEHHARPLTLDNLAEIAGCSGRYLNQIFQRRLQITPMQMLTDLRMKKAENLLLHTPSTLQQIAEQIGYASGYSLSRLFKMTYGIPPEQYRKQMSQPGVIQAESVVSSNTYARQLLSLAARHVHTPLGPVEVPQRPERVVVDWELGSLLALGLTPVGAPHTLIDHSRLLQPYLRQEIADIGPHNQVSLYQVMNLNPDLIITSSLDRYASYARLAPTVLFRADDYPDATAHMRAMGAVLNRSEQAEQWLSSYVRQAWKLRERMHHLIGRHATCSLMDPNWEQSIRLLGNTGHRGGKTVYELLNLRPSSQTRQALHQSRATELFIPQHLLARYAGDYLLILVSAQASSHGLKRDWQEEGKKLGSRVVELDWHRYFLTDPLSRLLQAEDLLQSMDRQRA